MVDVTAAFDAGEDPNAPTPESGAVLHTDGRIVCHTPPARAGAAATVDLYLTLNGADFGGTGLGFQYYTLPAVTRLTPSGGHRTGGTLVTIVGAGFDVLEGGAYVSCQASGTVLYSVIPGYTVLYTV